MKHALLLFACTAFLAACSGATGTGGPPPCADGPDWICDVQPVVQKHCADCHQPGGITPFALDTYAQASAVAGLMAAAVADGLMPPWPPTTEGGCPPMMGARVMTAAEKDAITAWAAAGAPEGVAGSVPPPPASSAAPQVTDHSALPTDIITVGQGYTPNASLEDDYRCFVVDLEKDGDAWLHAYDIQPGNRAIVHHVLLYVALPDTVARLQAWDDRDEGPGFTCFGAPAPGIPLTVGGWVPGQRPQAYRRGDGAWIPRGSRLVVQMHYNLLAGPAGDVTTVKLHWIDGQPFREVATLPFPVDSFSIPPGDPDHEVSVSTGVLPDVVYSADFQLKLEGVAPHMHLLGKRIRVEVEPPSGGGQCLVNIPRWDFKWQGFYLFEGDEPMDIPASSAFRLTCAWDNSAENQAVVDGVQQAPRTVTWGEGSRDEMCLAYLIVSGVPGWTATLLDLLDN